MRGLFKKVRFFLYLRYRNSFEKLYWSRLGLKITTLSGLQLFIKNRSDWDIYKEIFVRGDYDDAIQMAIQKATLKNECLYFFDLGANVGFFTCRIMDKLLQNSRQQPYEGVCVEGSLPVFKDLKDRFSRQPALNKLQKVFGLAGKKEGRAKIFESGNTMTNSVVSTSALRRNLSGRTVDYVNLENLVKDVNTIHLLKCDIEGSEEEFLENYQELLHKVNVCAIELHHKKCDTVRCRAILQACGLKSRQKVFDYGEDVSLEIFWRV